MFVSKLLHMCRKGCPAFPVPSFVTYPIVCYFERCDFRLGNCRSDLLLELLNLDDDVNAYCFANNRNEKQDSVDKFVYN